MIWANKKDKVQVVNILTDAFEDNKSVNYVIKQDSKRIDRIRNLMEYSFDMCFQQGHVFLSEDCKGTALLLEGKKKTTLRSTILDVQLIMKSLGLSNVSKVLDREKRINENYPEEFIYLWYIGVEKNFQKRGLGTKMLDEIIVLANERRKPIYLETSMFENLIFYKKHGFEIYKELNFDHKLYFLKKEPMLS